MGVNRIYKKNRLKLLTGTSKQAKMLLGGKDGKAKCVKDDSVLWLDKMMRRYV